MKTFEIGKTYSMSSVCDHNCVWTYTVVKRTAQTITIDDGKETKTCRVNKQATEYRGAETIYPLGRYSMCPSLSADAEVEVVEEDAQAEEVTAATVEPAVSNVVTISQPADDGEMILMIGQRVEGNFGAGYPVQGGRIIGFEEVPDGRFFRGGAYAVIRWDDRPEAPQRVRLNEIHRPGWRSANGSSLGVFIAR